jgi:surface antigen
VVACGDRETRRRSLYSGTGALRLCRPLHRLLAAAAVLAGLSVGGCAYRLDSMFAKTSADVEQTGSISRTGQQSGDANSAALAEVDLAYARAAAAEALSRGGRDLSVPWENPRTGASGNITPLAASYTEGSLTCRDFLASYVRGQTQSWLQGEACRADQGKWEVKSLKTLKQG